MPSTSASVAVTLTALGGCARAKDLGAHHSKRQIRRALHAGQIVRTARGRYALGSVAEHARMAHARSAVRSHLSAALAHGWAMKSPPTLPHLTFPRGRRLREGQRAGIVAHSARLTTEERERGVTDPLRTVLDCARTLPFDEALAVADSALRSGKVARGVLCAAAARMHGPGAVQARRVAAHADGRAANPLESVLRAHAIEEGFAFVPQLMVAESGLFAIVDLGDEGLRLILEAEGFEHHGKRSDVRRDCRRHTEFAIFGWDSLRYAYEDVMFEGDWVRWTLRTWRATQSGLVPETPPRSAVA